MLSKEDRVLIKVLRDEKGYGAKRIMTEFAGRNFSLAAVKRLLHQIDMTRSADRKSGSGRRRTARCDTNETVALLSAETPDFIGQRYWPPNSPDLNPVDYVVWGILQQRVYRCRIRDIDHLKERLIAEWHRFDQNTIDRAVNQWRQRLRGCVRQNGGHFEHQI